MQSFECRRVQLRNSEHDKGPKSNGFTAPYLLLNELLHKDQNYVSSVGLRTIIFPHEPLGILLDSVEGSFNTALWTQTLVKVDSEQAEEVLALSRLLKLPDPPVTESNNISYYRYYDITKFLETIDLTPSVLESTPAANAVGWAEVERLSHFGWELIGVDDGWAYLRKPVVLEVESLIPRQSPSTKTIVESEEVCGKCTHFVSGIANVRTGIIGGWCKKHQVNLNNKEPACSVFEPIEV